MIYITLLSYILNTIARDCSKLPSDYTKIVGKENEIIIQDVSQYFDVAKYNDDITLTDQNNKLTLLQPIDLQTTIQMTPNVNEVLSYSVLTNPQNQWINKFQLLAIRDQNEQILTWTKNIVAGTQQRFPIFDSTLLIGKTDETICQSSTILDISHLLLDCYQVNDQEPQTYLQLVSQDDDEQLKKIEITYPYDKNQKRYLVSTYQYIYRITLKTNNNPAIIEIFTYDILSKTITLKQTINKELMQSYVNITEYSFDMVDAKISPNDQIYILDKTGNLFNMQYYSTNNTWQFYHQEYLLGESISFDYNFQRQECAILQKNTILYRTNSYTSVEDLSNSKLYFTNNFLILASSTKMIAFDKYLYIIQSVNGDFRNLLVDQSQNDFLALTNQNIKHFFTNLKYRIKYQNNDQGITGTSKLNLNGCQVTIDYQTVSKNSVDLILISKGKIQDQPFFSDYFQRINNQPRQLVSGPKQKIQFQKKVQDKLYGGGNMTSIQISGNIEGKYSNKNLSLTDLIFVQTVSMAQSFDQPYAIITQNKQKTLTIYSCQNLLIEICQILYQAKLDFEITEKNTLIDYYSYEYNFITLLDKKTLFLYKFYANTYFNRTITFKDDDEINSIDSIYLNNNYLILFQKETKKIGIYNFQYVDLYYVINSNSLKRLGFNDWDPQQLYSNDFSDILFVINGQEQTQLLMLNITKYDFSLGFNIQIAKSKDTRIINFYDRFAVLKQYENGAYTFDIYNRQDATNVYLEKTPSFYDYKIENLNSFFWVSYNNLIHVKAKSEFKSVILSYIVELTDHNSLFCVQDWDPANEFVTATQNTILQFNKDNVWFYYIQRYPNLQYQVKFDDDTFITNEDYQIVYSNEQLLLLDQQFRLVNTNVNLKIDASKLNISTNLTSEKQNNYRQDMGSDWFQGEVTQFSLILPQFNQSKVEIINPIEIVQDYYLNNTKNVVDFSTEYLFVLKNESYLLVSKKTNQVVVNEKITTDYLCEDIIASFNQQVLIQCFKSGKQYVGGVQCDNTNCKIGSSWLQIDDDIITGYIDTENIFLIKRTCILAYSNNILDLSKSKNYGIMDFYDTKFYYGKTIYKIKNNHYQVYCTDYDYTFYIFEYSIKENQIQKTNKITFNLYDFINQDFYIQQYSLFSLIKTINVQVTDNSYKADIIIFATEGPHYGIHVEFTCQADKCELDSKKIVFILQGYGSFSILGYLFTGVKIVNNFIQVSYTDGARMSLVQTIYQLPKIQTTHSATTFFAALKPFYYNSKRDLQQELYSYDNKLYFLTDSSHLESLALYKINFSPQLLLDGKINNSTGFLSILNDFSMATVPINIYVPGNNDDNDDGEITSNNHKGLWITLGVIGGACLIFGTGFYCYKKKKTKVETLI